MLLLVFNSCAVVVLGVNGCLGVCMVDLKCAYHLGNNDIGPTYKTNILTEAVHASAPSVLSMVCSQ